jgi:hypothetical protein
VCGRRSARSGCPCFLREAEVFIVDGSRLAADGPRCAAAGAAVGNGPVFAAPRTSKTSIIVMIANIYLLVNPLRRTSGITTARNRPRGRTTRTPPLLRGLAPIAPRPPPNGPVRHRIHGDTGIPSTRSHLAATLFGAQAVAARPPLRRRPATATSTSTARKTPDLRSASRPKPVATSRRRRSWRASEVARRLTRRPPLPGRRRLQPTQERRSPHLVRGQRRRAGVLGDPRLPAELNRGRVRRPARVRVQRRRPPIPRRSRQDHRRLHQAAEPERRPKTRFAINSEIRHPDCHPEAPG